jgi:hypothetical protein
MLAMSGAFGQLTWQQVHNFVEETNLWLGFAINVWLFSGGIFFVIGYLSNHARPLGQALGRAAIRALITIALFSVLFLYYYAAYSVQQIFGGISDGIFGGLTMLLAIGVLLFHRLQARFRRPRE